MKGKLGPHFTSADDGTAPSTPSGGGTTPVPDKGPLGPHLAEKPLTGEQAKPQTARTTSSGS